MKNQDNHNTADNVPQLRFPEFTGEWEMKKLGEVCEIIGGGTPETSVDEYWNGTIQWFTPTEIKSDYVSKSIRTITELGLQKSSAKKLSIGTILLTTRASIGEASIALEECTTNQGFQSLIAKKGINNIYIFNWIKKNKYELTSRANGSTFLEVSKSEIEKIPIPIPTLPEQTKIANFFTAVDEKLQALKTKKRLLQQYKKGVMQQLFSQQLRFKNDNGKEFPKWEMKDGNGIFDAISNKNHDSDLPILAISQEFGAVPREMINYQISVTEKSIDSYKVIEVGDFIISLRSFQGGIEFSKYKGICSPAYIILRNSIPINSLFYKEYFKTDFYIQKLCEKLEGIRDGKMISYKYFSDIKLPYPSLPEQTLIANFLSSLDEKINSTENQIQKTQAWKKGLLQQMFV